MPYNSPGILEVENEYRYFDCPISRFVSLTVIEQPIDINFGTYNGNGGASSATYAINDQTLFPGSNPIPQGCDCIRYRNHTRGVSGRLTIAARLASDLPTGVELSASYVPSYYRITPEGRVEATFEGKINAKGLNVPASLAGEVAESELGNQVRWYIEELTRLTVAELVAVHEISPGFAHEEFRINLKKKPFPSNGQEAGVRLLSERASSNVSVHVEEYERKLLDQSQRSSYLQWANAGAGAVSRRQILIGTTSVTATVVGQAAYEFTMSSEFATRCEFIMTSTIAVETSWPTIRGTVVAGRGRGRVVLESPTRQTIVLLYVAIGE